MSGRRENLAFLKDLFEGQSVITVLVILLSASGFAGTYSGGTGDPNTPYLIGTAEDILEMSNEPNDWDDHFLMIADVNMVGYVFTEAVIGTFTGNFDGNNNVVSNFTIDAAVGTYIGLFGCVAPSGQIRNLGLIDADIKTGFGDMAGGLSGKNEGTITNCYVTGSVTGDSYLGGLVGSNNGILTACYTSVSVSGYGRIGGLAAENVNGTITNSNSTGIVDGYEYVGGLVGQNYYNAMTDCYSTSSVSGNNNVGGLVGYTGYSSTLSNCYATGGVSGVEYVGGMAGNIYSTTTTNCYATGIVSGINYIGGLAGYIDEHGNIANCFALGSVDGDSYVGGLSGIINYAEVINCYATGNVSGGIYAGGLTGYAIAIITNCYSAGIVTGDSYLGGLAGGHDLGFYSNSFWNSEINPSLTGIGNISDPPDVVGITTLKMQVQSTFTDHNWDFVDESTNGTSDIWRMCVDSIHYPHLFHQYNVNGDFACPDGVGLDDLTALCQNWLNTEETDPNFNYPCDPTFDSVTNLPDFGILSDHWLE